jgi:D-alanine-D-alanine ligase
MKIGITYDLKSDYLKLGFSKEQAAEFDNEETIIGIENSLKRLHLETERIGHIKNLVKALNEGKRWDLVFNICEGVYGIGREAQVPALLDAWNIPYVFSDTLVLSLTLHKAMTKRVIRDAGIPTADFFVAYSLDDIKNVNIPYPLFAKPLAEGTGKGINQNSIINDDAQLQETCSYILKTFEQPVLIEKFLSGREFTVGMVGTGNNARCVGLMEVLLTKKAEKDVYSYGNKSDYLDRVKYRVPEKDITQKCYEVALKAWNVLECRDGGRIDLRCDEQGIPNFIEVNPLAGLNPIDSDLPILCKLNGISYDELIEMIMNSALSRIRN